MIKTQYSRQKSSPPLTIQPYLIKTNNNQLPPFKMSIKIPIATDKKTLKIMSH
ncbi:protein of unknown function [Xenorhabdus poinarii G6]|uniref:Uncharacterized protein n=1 Tax=Xenorhabdus poinarii G6 TaxID=1354304 RepID=A0A068R2N8_9GAMM|nr:protein of unknown function [Xenorhabdus poinarii G6]